MAPKSPARSKSPAKERVSPAKKKSATKKAGASYLPWAISFGIAIALCSSAAVKAVVLKAVNGMGAMPLIDLFHATAVAHEYRKFAEPQGAVQRLIAILVTALGGTTMMSFLIGQPCGWLCDNETLTAYIVAWLLMQYTPYDVVFKALDGTAASRFVMGVLDDISWGTAITKWGMFKALSAMHEAPRGSAVAALLCGLVAGCGGGIMQQCASLLKTEWRFSTPDAFRAGKIGFGVKASAACATLSYLLLDPHGHVASAVPPSMSGVWPKLDRDGTLYVAIVVMICAATVRSTLEKLM